MSNEVVVKLSGFTELSKRLSKIQKDGEELAQTVLAEPARVYLDAVAAAAPGKTGFLRKHFIYGPARWWGLKSTLEGSRVVTVTAGPSMATHPLGFIKKGNKKKSAYRSKELPNAVIAYMVEFGTRFAAAHPFIRPTWERMKPIITAMIARKIKDKLLK